MSEIFNNSHLNDFLNNMVNGDLTLVTEILWLVIATIISMLGGAIGGMILAGKDIGYSLSATLGALFAPTAAIIAIVLGFFTLTFLNNY
ncbi:hypothetical protein [Nostoc sp. TCL26-01]|uniref:hypothetical protein n=1 Tax=Nostoc sp. TCL26-01 TaxID=2576904 RepID=UPI0015BE8916|nr:hypothetical protein [Nostoc sp. TCL26-01]QLE59212.1 hypothetical protein FD725_29180 [Nostoc sp. TCL26-01]